MENFLGLIALDWLMSSTILQHTEGKTPWLRSIGSQSTSTRHRAHQGSASNLRRSWSRSCSLFMRMAPVGLTGGAINEQLQSHHKGVRLTEQPITTSVALWNCPRPSTKTTSSLEFSPTPWWRIGTTMSFGCKILKNDGKCSEQRRCEVALKDPTSLCSRAGVSGHTRLPITCSTSPISFFFQVSHQLPEMNSGCQLAEVETRDCRDWLWEDTCWKHADQGRVLSTAVQIENRQKSTKEYKRCIKNH